jgi:hypothetical protein
MLCGKECVPQLESCVVIRVHWLCVFNSAPCRFRCEAPRCAVSITLIFLTVSMMVLKGRVDRLILARDLGVD